MKWFCIFIGGGLGSVLRYVLSLRYEFSGNHFPWGTFFINISGALIIGIINGILIKYKEENTELKYFFITGICGGYTTFSTFSLEFFKLIENKKTTLAIYYAALSILLGGLAAGIGLKTINKFF